LDEVTLIGDCAPLIVHPTKLPEAFGNASNLRQQNAGKTLRHEKPSGLRQRSAHKKRKEKKYKRKIRERDTQLAKGVYLCYETVQQLEVFDEARPVVEALPELTTFDM